MLNKARRFGIEFEFAVPQKELKDIAYRSIQRICGKKCCISLDEKYSVQDNFNKWHIKRENESIGEINTPISKLCNLKKISKVISYLGKKKVPVNDECGLHVHIEIKDVNRYNIMGYWLHCEKGILSCFPFQRRKSTAVERIITDKKDSKKLVAELLERKADTASHGDIISLRDWEDRKTVEFRIAEGTTDTNLVVNWTKFLLYWIEYAKSLEPSLVPCKRCNSINMEDILNEIDADEETKDFMMYRYEKYHKLPYWVSF